MDVKYARVAVYWDGELEGIIHVPYDPADPYLRPLDILLRTVRLADGRWDELRYGKASLTAEEADWLLHPAW